MGRYNEDQRTESDFGPTFSNKQQDLPIRFVIGGLPTGSQVAVSWLYGSPTTGTCRTSSGHLDKEGVQGCTHNAFRGHEREKLNPEVLDSALRVATT